MEKLNLPVNIESFQTCNKSSLVEGKQYAILCTIVILINMSFYLDG